MPWDSRIKNEWHRRIVIAGVMLLVLGGSTGLAAWISLSRRTLIPAGESTHQIGKFSVALGSNWQTQRTDDTNTPPQWTELTERGQTGRVLQVIQLQSTNARPPLDAMQQAMAQLSPSAGWVNGDAVQRNGHTQLVYAGQSMGSSRMGNVPFKHVLAVVTADGRYYLAIHLKGSGRISRQDVDALWAIASSATDVRYELTTASTLNIGPIELELPRGLSASVDRSSAIPTMLLGPLRTGRFYRLNLRYFDQQTLRDQFAEAQDTKTASTSELLQATLAIAFEQLHGSPPGEQQLATLKADGRDVHIVILRSGPASATHQEIWAVDIDGQGGLILELTCETDAAKLARYAAQLLLTDMKVQPAPGAQP